VHIDPLLIVVSLVTESTLNGSSIFLSDISGIQHLDERGADTIAFRQEIDDFDMRLKRDMQLKMEVAAITIQRCMRIHKKINDAKNQARKDEIRRGMLEPTKSAQVHLVNNHPVLANDAIQALNAILEDDNLTALERALNDYEAYKNVREVGLVLAEVEQKLESLRQVLPMHVPLPSRSRPGRHGPLRGGGRDGRHIAAPMLTITVITTATTDTTTATLLRRATA
jgi:hypothetical protein